ncbi:MAG: TlyA family RNA methyltransferase [Candidatus Coproplasma sp.]
MRIDKFLTEKYGTRTKAAEAIKANLVKVNGKFVTPSFEYNGEPIEFIERQESFVSNGGYKLSKALKDFGFSVEGKTFVDIGASNGGFTDCLFQNGAKKVYCVDVGESQLDKSLLSKNVVIIDNFNARNLNCEMFDGDVDGVVIDVSFISLTYILPGVSNILKDGDYAIALIKPQFECESRKVGKNGIVKDIALRKKIVEKICTFALEVGLTAEKITKAPIRKGKNVEYLVLLKKGINIKGDINKLIKYTEF